MSLATLLSFFRVNHCLEYLYLQKRVLVIAVCFFPALLV